MGRVKHDGIIIQVRKFFLPYLHMAREMQEQRRHEEDLLECEMENQAGGIDLKYYNLNASSVGTAPSTSSDWTAYGKLTPSGIPKNEHRKN